jgi:hypothetical protein
MVQHVFRVFAMTILASASRRSGQHQSFYHYPDSVKIRILVAKRVPDGLLLADDPPRFPG